MSAVTSLRFSAPNRSFLAGASESGRKVSFAGRNPYKAGVRPLTETGRSSVAARKAASLYEVLQVKHNATAREIKTAYRTLAKLCHPDAARSATDGRDFIEIQKAYATLSDPAARALYDVSLRCGSGRQPLTYSVAGVRRSGFCRRWETDQCW